MPHDSNAINPARQRQSSFGSDAIFQKHYPCASVKKGQVWVVGYFEK
jgi:hypothetical protein